MKHNTVFLALVFFAAISGVLSAADVLIPAENMSSRSDGVNPRDGNWSNLAVLHGQSGFVEWTAQVETSGAYYVHILYASGESRETILAIDGNVIAEPILSKLTGGFHAAHLQWETLGPFDFAEGKHTIRLSTNNYMPHFRGLALSNEKNSPAADVFEEQERRIRLAELERRRTEMNATREDVRNLLAGVESILFVRRKTLQSSHYYTDFIDGCVYFGSDLCVLSLNDGSVRTLLPESLTSGIVGRCNLSYDGKKIIFDYKAKIGEGFRIWEIGVDGTGLRQLTFPPADESARIAKYRQDWHPLYHHHTDDMHPCYLPDGGFCFVSTRCEFGILCDGPDILTTSVLYRADSSGNNIEKLSNSSLSESAPAVMRDGRILYTRWEYVDNGATTNKGLWAVRPDGTGSAEVYGASIVFPSVFHVARPIPGTNDLFVAIGAPHMPLGVGTVMRIDTNLNLRNGDPVTYITPEVDTRHQWGWDNIAGGATKPFQPEGLIHTSYEWDGRGNTSQGPLFMDPFPLDAERFLVSYNPDKPWNTPDAYGLYLIDEHGVRKLLHLEPDSSCWSAIPIRPREKESVSEGTIDPELAKNGLAQAIVTDVYRGLDGVPRGTIKYIRVNEQVPRPWAARRFWGNIQDDCVDQQHSAISLNTHLGLKLQDGIVPVEEDGSANFLVRADKNIFFQVLDENFMEVQRERTFVNFRPGEVRSCVGCHEQAGAVSKTAATFPLALMQPPKQPGPQPGEETGARPLHYPSDVQPVLDRYCAACHGGTNPKGGLRLDGELTQHFSRSYEELMKRDPFPVIGENHPKAGNNHYLPPYTLGSHASKLVKRITDPKSECFTDMTPEDRVKITTWVDSNGQYYGTYYGKKNLKFREEENFRPVPSYEDVAR
ncbi:MAG: hypothetical protein ACRC46_15075 [Thermoguttaceae bacterium]